VSRANLVDFDVGPMVRLVSELRALALTATSVESFAQRLCELLRDTFVHEGKEQTALVRFYGTAALGALPEAERAYAGSRRLPLEDTTTCLTLLGTAGVEPPWNDRRNSVAHRVVPLVDADHVATMPMIAALLLQLGIDVEALAAGQPDVVVKSADGSCRIFHVEQASGSPLIPDQDFVAAHGIECSIGFGGSLPTGEVFAVVMFCNVAVALASAELFETVALSIRLATLDMLDLPLLEGGPAVRACLSPQELLVGRHEFAQALLVAHEQIAATQADRVHAALQQARYDAGRAASLANVVSRLANVESVPEVIDVLLQAGLPALGSDGLSVALVDSDRLAADVTISEGFGSKAAATFARLPLDDALPTTLTARRGDVVVVEDVLGEPHDFPSLLEVARQVGVRAVVSLPMRARGDLIGALTCTWSNPRTFDDSSLEHFQALATQAAQAIDRWRLLQLERQQNATLAASLLTSPPTSDSCEIVARYLPAAELAQVGGDWHDSFLQQDGATMVVIGDVVGHDTAAAAAMGQLRGLLRGIAWYAGCGPADTLKAIDAAAEGLLVHTTASCVVARLEQTQEAGRRGVTNLRWSNAGHPPPMIINPDGSVLALVGVEADLLLGVDPDTERVESSVTLDRGSTLVLYTDGLVERRGQSLEDGLHDLKRVLAQVAHLPLTQLCDTLLERLIAGADDDIALLAVRLHV
jgi:serine phosphatase RsbU (regulator of sigma subunit)